jgi:hypothetical protein
MPQERTKQQSPSRLGDQSPRYEFFLNPYVDARFTTCPRAHGPTRQRKLPLVIHIDDWGLLVLNKECRFCPTCELVVVHQDDLEELLAMVLAQHAPRVVGSKYFVVGTLDRRDWRKSLKQPLTATETIAALHDFLRHLKFEQPGWVWTGPSGREL